ncbi:unnamed protein product, partial [Amoebophrya sp. A120]
GVWHPRYVLVDDQLEVSTPRIVPIEVEVNRLQLPRDVFVEEDSLFFAREWYTSQTTFLEVLRSYVLGIPLRPHHAHLRSFDPSKRRFPQGAELKQPFEDALQEIERREFFVVAWTAATGPSPTDSKKRSCAPFCFRKKRNQVPVDLSGVGKLEIYTASFCHTADGVSQLNGIAGGDCADLDRYGVGLGGHLSLPYWSRPNQSFVVYQWFLSLSPALFPTRNVSAALDARNIYTGTFVPR